MYKINVFISHSWEYENHYEKLEEWIFRNTWKVSQTPLKFYNFSIPKNDPIHNARTSRELMNRIYAEIQKSHVVVIPTGLYAAYSNWIQKEIDGAKQCRRPILAVNLWARERKSSVVIKASNELVGWKKDSVVSGIWQLYRKYYRV